MEVQYEYTLADAKAASAHLHRPGGLLQASAKPLSRTALQLVIVLPLALIFTPSITAFAMSDSSRHEAMRIFMTLVVASVLLAMTLVAFRRSNRSLLDRCNDAGLLGPLPRPVTCRITPEGLSMVSPAGDSLVRWHAVLAIDLTKGHVMFTVVGMSGYVVPIRAFASQAAAEAFYQEAMRLRHPAPPTQPEPLGMSRRSQNDRR